MKNKLNIGIGILSLLFLLFIGDNVNAQTQLIKLGETINPSNTYYSSSTTTNWSLSMWHSSNKSWKIYYPNRIEKLDDGQEEQLFPSGGYNVLKNEIYNVDIPEDIKKYVDKYGTDAVGIKVTSKNPNSIYNQLVNVDWGYVKGELKLTVTFRPKLGYYSHNYWQSFDLWNMKGGYWKNIFVAKPLPGYGHNRISIDGGDWGMVMDDDIARTAYVSNNQVRFRATHQVDYYTWDNIYCGTTKPSDHYSESTFWGSGNMGVVFDFPMQFDFYVKKKDAPYLKKIEVHNSPYETSKPVDGKLYDTEKTYWFKNNTDFSYTITTGSDLINLWKVNTAVKEANTWDYWFNGGDESNVGVYVNRYEKGKGLVHRETVCVDGNERMKKTKYTFQAQKDIDIAICADAINRESQWMVGLDGNPKSEAVDGGYRIKTDGDAPSFKSIRVKSRNATGITIALEGIYDTRSGVGKVQFPTWSGDTQEELKWKTFNLKSSQNPQENIKMTNKYEEDGYTKYDFEYTIKYSDWKHPNNILCHVYVEDNVGNSIGNGNLDLKIKPSVSTSIDNANYKNVDGNYIDYWFNGSTIANINVTSSSTFNTKERWLRLYKTEDTSSHIYSVDIQSKNSAWDKDNAFISVNRNNIVNSLNQTGYTFVDRFEVKGSVEGDYYTSGMVKDIYNETNSLTNKKDRLRIDLTSPTISCNTNKGILKDKVVKFTMKDSRSGVRDYRYRLVKNGTTGKSSDYIVGSEASININDGDGEYYIEVQARDNVYNSTSWKRFGPFEVDTTAPTSKIVEITGHKYKDGNVYWFKGNTSGTIKTNTIDGVTGSRKVSLSLDNSNKKGFNALFIENKYELQKEQTIENSKVSDFNTEYIFEGTALKRNILWKPTFTNFEGNYPLSVSSQDYALNTSGWSTKDLDATIKVDSTNPTGVFNIDEKMWTNNNIVVNFKPSDARSGVNKWRYSLSSDEGKTYSQWSEYINGATAKDITISGNGSWKIKCEVIDNVTNSATIISKGTYKIDKIPPTITINPIEREWTNKDIVVTTTATDTGGSGIKYLKEKVLKSTGSNFEVIQDFKEVTNPKVTTFTKDGIYKIEAITSDNANNITSKNSKEYKLDKTKPSIKSIEFDEENVKPSGFKIKFNEVTDNLSGVKKMTYTVYPKKDTSQKKTYEFNTVGGNIEKQVNTSLFNNATGDYIVSFTIMDNANNVYTSSDQVVNVPAPIPKNEKWSIEDVNYIDGNNYWVKPNHVFTIKQIGSFPIEWGLYPDYLATKFEINSEAILYKANINSSNLSKSFTEYFNAKDNSQSIIKESKNDKNYLTGWYKTSAKNHGDIFTLSYSSGKNYFGSDFSKYSKSDIKLKVDGIAPSFKDTANSKIDENLKINVKVNEDESSVYINVKNVIDTDSGVKKVFANIYPAKNKKMIKSIDLTTNNKSDWEIKINNLYDMFNTSELTLEIYTEDNVGNVGMIKSQKIDLFTVSANVTRVLEPHEPIFKCGEKGILHIKLTGGVDKVKIVFPEKLTNKDKTLNTEYEVEPKSIRNEEYEFFIPLNVENGSYKVQVIGYKNGAKKEAYPNLQVVGSVLDDIRTRIRTK